MNKLLLAFCMGSMGIVTQQLHSISLIDYIHQHGIPEVVDGKLDLSDKNLTDVIGLQDILNIGQEVGKLDLSGNQIQTLPVDVFTELSNLRLLHLDDNQLQTLPSNIFNGLQSLRYLSLSNNQIQELPSTIFNGLYNLRVLSLSNNQIQELPSTIFNGLHNLWYLYLHNNQIQTLPSNIFNDLQSLNYLQLDNNQIKTLPDTIFNDLQSLKYLHLQGNNFTSDFIPMLTNLLLNIPKLVEINDMPKNEALRKQPFVTLKQLAAENISQNLDKYWPRLHTLSADILDALPLNEQQRQEIEEQREKPKKERQEIEKKHEVEERRTILSCSLV